ncbi:uncharacterized protein LOC123707123 [Pieris brassicae]|uniref:DUF4771 domain-containing protein n=1 Tax=Pieris brassicae TaxID=7116 RepID=A0A9P0X607_PIEBR|nr:uncharacterized protein LOC123707123 [Pieris brassicae]CAH4015792.1 unnamed protein product [Pieris brassicae]
MVAGEHGPETSYEERAQRRLQVVYSKQTKERQVFMQELKELRKRRDKKILKIIRDMIGPRWYQALSVPQREALDSLEFSIYQDLLEGKPVRSADVMRRLGLYPRPNEGDLMNCLYLGRKDPKETLAQLFYVTYGHPIDGKQLSYALNARLMLSAILYLGLNNLLELLKKRFQADPEKKKSKEKPKPKSKPELKSPYLQDMIAVLYSPPKRKPFKPKPLPNLEDLNEPYEEEPPILRPPPPAPPPPPRKKRIPRACCDRMAGVMNIEPHSSITAVTMKTVTRTSRHHKTRGGSKFSVTEVKKTYGISMSRPKRGRGRKKVNSPSTGIWNSQYMITGVHLINGKPVFVLANVTILPAMGELIHGGYRYIGGECININSGIRGWPPPPKSQPCECLHKWQSVALDYVKRTKCHCGHHFDYGNEGVFPAEELPFFQKPTRHAPYKFNYETIYDLDEKHLHVEKEFKRIWETDSALCVPDPNSIAKKEKKKKKTKRSSATCLGQSPKPEDYLRCALRQMRKINIAARLPDIHLVPELKEWMRYRIFGPYTAADKKEYLRQSSIYWQMFLTLAAKGFGHVDTPRDPLYAGHTTWVHKQALNDKFRKFTHRYKLQLFRSLANVNNMLWPTMNQAQFPDKKFREIFFSYLFSRIEDLQLMHPYSSREAIERKYNIAKKRYICLPAGIEPEE